MKTKTTDWRNRPPQESVADFKQRLALMIRERETGKKYSVIGAAPTPPALLRPKDAAPTPSEVLNQRKEQGL
jgi:hypothetical protein